LMAHKQERFTHIICIFYLAEECSNVTILKCFSSVTLKEQFHPRRLKI
jgi:hypothetical protein